MPGDKFSFIIAIIAINYANLKVSRNRVQN